jgi:hypothetical protein
VESGEFIVPDVLYHFILSLTPQFVLVKDTQDGTIPEQDLRK